MDEVQKQIHEIVTNHPIVLFMKGIPDAPQCGFSATAVQILKACGVEEFAAVDVLRSPAIRDGVKQYANWPTVPQLYIKGEFVGGCDIMKEMHQSGELQKQIAGLAAA